MTRLELPPRSFANGFGRRVPAMVVGAGELEAEGRWIVRREAEVLEVVRAGAGGGTVFCSVFLGRAYLRSDRADGQHEGAHNCTHSRAVSSCFFLFRLSSCAMAGTSGSAGLGSVRRDERERMTL